MIPNVEFHFFLPVCGLDFGVNYRKSGYFDIKDTTGTYYIIGRLTIKMLSLSNLREIESWLKGEVSGAKRPRVKDAPDKFGEFLFNTALKISGLKDISDETRTPDFTIENGGIVFRNKE